MIKNGTYGNSCLELTYIERGGRYFLRLTTPERFNGVRIFKQRPIAPSATSREWYKTFRVLYEDAINLHRRQGI